MTTTPTNAIARTETDLSQLSIAPDSIGRFRPPWFVSFLAWRLVWAFVTLALFLTAVFFFMQVWVPYSWATFFKTGGGDAYQAALEAAGLNRPIHERFVDFVATLASGDLGTSFYGDAVFDMIREAVPVTLTVFVAGIIIAWVAGEMLGRLGSWRRGAIGGSAIAIIGVMSVTIFPPFLVFVMVRFLRGPLLELREILGLPVDSLAIWRDAVTGQPGALMPADVRWLTALGLIGALAVALVLRSYGRRHQLALVEALALPGMLVAVGVGIWAAGVGQHALDLLYRVDITATTGRGSPALALAAVVLLGFGQVMMMMRSGMDAERAEDYVLTARAKGLTDRAVRDRHVARNVIAPVLAGSFATLPTLLAGMIIVEYELQMQGLSSVLFYAIEFQDIPVIMGVLVVLGLFGVGIRIVIDLAIASLDPRLRRARA